MRAVWLSSFLMFILQMPASALAQETERLPESPQESAISKIFADRVKDYVAFRDKLEGELPGLKSTNDSAEITAHQQLLSSKVVAGRKDARQGDLFTPEVAKQFREIIRRTFQEPGGQAVRRTVDDEDAPKSVAVKVNAVYPPNIPLQTTPPTLLKRLPALPMELAYRILGRSIVLLDNKTNLIVDFIPNVVP